MCAVVEQALSGLQASGIRWCILHQWEALQGDLSSDLDLAVAPDDVPDLERALHELQEPHLVQVLQHETTCFYYVLAGMEGQDWRFVPLDVATDYRRDGMILFGSEELLRDRQAWQGLPVAAPSTEFGYLIVKKVLKGNVSTRQRQRLRKLVGALAEQARAITHRRFGAAWGERLLGWVREGQWDELHAHLPSLRRALFRQTLRHDPLAPLRYGLPELRRIWHRLRFPTGMVVAILGPDGAGKSTLIESLHTRLAGAFRQTDGMHLRPGLLGSRSSGVPATNPHRDPPRGRLGSLAKLAYYLVDYVLGHAVKIRPRLACSTLVLFDRHYADILVDPLRYRCAAPHWLLRQLLRCIPAPDLYVILDVPVSGLLERKQELPAAELERQRAAYLKLATELENAVVVDGSRSPDAVALQVTTAILDQLRRRQQGRRESGPGREVTPGLVRWAQRVMALGGGAGAGGDRSDYGLLSLPGGRGLLIPLSSRRTAAATLELYNASTCLARTAKRVLATGLRLGFAQVFLPRAPVRRPTDADGSVDLHSTLASLFEGQEIRCGVSLGTPGPHRKPVLQVMDREGHVLGYAKVGWNADTTALLRNEAHMLRTLAERRTQAFAVPQLLHAGSAGDTFLCVLSAALPTRPGLPVAQGDLPVQVVTELADLGLRRMPLHESPYWADLRRQVEQVRTPGIRPLLERGLHDLATSAGDQALPFHPRHGDLAPWNAKWVGDRWFIYDWEYATDGAPAAWDLFHFEIQTRLLNDRDSASAVARRVNADLLPRKVQPFLAHLQAEPDCARHLLLAYLLDRLAFSALYDSENRTLLHQFRMLVQSVMGL